MPDIYTNRNEGGRSKRRIPPALITTWGLAVYLYFYSEGRIHHYYARSSRREKSAEEEAIVCHHAIHGNISRDAGPLSPKDSGVPYFIIHVGPPKTATTYVQEELTLYADLLRREDNLTYGGKFLRRGSSDSALGSIVNSLRDRSCQERALHALEATGDLQLTTWTAPDPVECWSRFLLSLEEYRLDGRSVLVSEEAFSMPRFAPAWKLLHRDLHSSGKWHLVVLVAYRRLADWLPSSKQQMNLWTPMKRRLNLWPGAGGGRECERTMDWIRVALKNPLSYLNALQVVDSIPTDELRIDVRVLDIDHPGASPDVRSSVRSDLFCRVLGDITSNACEASRRGDVTEPKIKSNPRQTEFYDRLGTDAAAAGLLGRDFAGLSRRDVSLEIRRQQEGVFNRTSLDFALDCPTRGELEALLNASLAMETDLARRGFVCARIDDHRRSFWNNTQQYCWINTSAVLATEEWSTFFRNYANISNHKQL